MASAISTHSTRPFKRILRSPTVRLAGDDLLHVLRDPGVSDAQRGAARVLLDNDFAFFRMASAGDDGKFNGLIDIGDIDRSFEGGQPRQLTGEQYQDLASDFLDFKMQGVAADDLYGQKPGHHGSLRPALHEQSGL